MIDKQTMYDIIETEIMDCFDFKSVHDIMVHLKWQWPMALDADDDGVPQPWVIRQKARSLLRECGEKLLDDDQFPDFGIATGGLHAMAYRDHDTIRFRLQFVLEQWEEFLFWVVAFLHGLSITH